MYRLCLQLTLDYAYDGVSTQPEVPVHQTLRPVLACFPRNSWAAISFRQERLIPDELSELRCVCWPPRRPRAAA